MVGKVEEISAADLAMMRRLMMLGEVVGKVLGSLILEDNELALADFVLDPVEMHGNSFGLPLLDGFVDKTRCGVVVRVHGSGRLGVVHFFECNDDGAGIFGIEEEDTEFCFYCR